MRKTEGSNFLKKIFKWDEPRYESTLGMKYPTYRDVPVKTGEIWLRGKRIDDGAEGLWRINDELYDFSDFVNRHPGGAEWLALTKGTDITEAFHVHHVWSSLPEEMLDKFRVRAAKSTRTYPFTFDKNGFYMTLKVRVRAILRDLPKSTGSWTKAYSDTLFLGTLVLARWACTADSYLLATLAGLMLSLNTLAAHNFVHSRDNFRMYYFELSGFPYREMRIMHALSHHLHTNTVQDMEISVLEPFYQYLPDKNKTLLARYGSWLYVPFTYCTVFLYAFIRRWFFIVFDNKGWNRINETDLIPFLLPTVMLIYTGANLAKVIFWWMFVVAIASFHHHFTALNSAHHHPDIFHDGDAPRPQNERDWGISQLDAVSDRKEVTGNHFLVLTNFGDHLMHHMFPTVDHGHLQYLYPVLKETCKEFGLEYMVKSQWELVLGQFKQLRNNTPNPNPPSNKKT